MTAHWKFIPAHPAKKLASGDLFNLADDLPAKVKEIPQLLSSIRQKNRSQPTK